VLSLLALVLLVAMLLPAMFSQSVHRMKTWFNLIVACIIYCVSFLLLLGRQSGPEPPLPLCVFQAGLIYAAPATVAAAGLAFAIELYLRLSATLSNVKFHERRVTILLFLSPSVHLIVFWVAIFTALSLQRGPGSPPIAQRSSPGIYCNIQSNIPTTVTGATVIFLLGLMIIVEAYTVVYLIRKRSGFWGIKVPGGAFPLRLFIRTVAYTFVGGLGIILVDVFMNSHLSKTSATYAVMDLMAIIPLSVALVFGSQMDLIGVYMCWRKKDHYNTNPTEKV